MAAITRWSTGSAVCSAVLRSPPLPSEPLLALRSANQLRTNSWTGSSSIPSGRCRSSPSSGATSTTTNAPTAPWAIALLLQRPSSPPLLQALSVSHDLWYNYWGQVSSSDDMMTYSIFSVKARQLRLRAIPDALPGCSATGQAAKLRITSFTWIFETRTRESSVRFMSISMDSSSTTR